MILPGWGQAVNKEYWKIPIYWAGIIGVAYYSFTIHQDYSDYRAAYYNLNNDDLRYGPTPLKLQNVSTLQLKSVRNQLRNKRDLMIVMTVMAYGFNVLDAYVFAHLKDFDVSDNLTYHITPVWDNKSTGMKFSVTF